MSLYAQLAEIPVPVSAQFVSENVVQVNYSIKDHARNVKRSMSKSISVQPSGPPIATQLQDIDTVAQVKSASGKKTAALRNVKGSGGDVTRIVEIWNLGALEVSLNVTDYHGDFYTDEFVGSLSFSPSELSIVYTAEEKLADDKENDPYKKFRFNPDFGEGLTGKRRPTTFILRWKRPDADSVSPAKISLTRLLTPAEMRFGQAVFSMSSDELIYATGYELTQDGRFLGIKGCFNRPSGIWELRSPGLATVEYLDKDKISHPVIGVPTEARKLTPAHLSCRSPRIIKGINDEETLLWLASKTGGAHLASSTLHALGISSEGARSGAKTLVGVVDIPDKSNKGFPGLFPAYSLTPTFATRNEAGESGILLTSQWGSRTTVISVALGNGTVYELSHADETQGLQYHSWSVLASDGRNQLLCSRSAPGVPFEVVLGTMNVDNSLKWTVLDKPVLSEGVAAKLSTLRTSILPIPGRPLVETILIQGPDSSANGVPPCITAPHGGPHGTVSTAFNASTAAMVLEGYTMSFPNYTGSPGYGEVFLQNLIGRCGELDVQDCIASARYLAERGISELRPGKQLITGGSHGGFLTAHLIGQFPDFFSAAVLRNPVIHAGDISNTDIPDWYFAEFGLDYPLASVAPISSYGESSPAADNAVLPPRLDSATFGSLLAASPAAHIDAITVPVLLLMGASDRRVAPAQGIEFYHALKARYARRPGARVEMLIFEGEGHPLDGVEASRVGFEAGRDWFADVVKSFT